MRFLINSEAEMAEKAADFAKILSPGDCVALIGQMGAGKTVFVKGMAKALGFCDEVLSPTFTVMNIYEGETRLCHYDGYRLKTIEEAEEAGLTDFLGAKDCICAVEWPEIFLTAGYKMKKIEINYISEKTRELIIYDE